MAIIDELTPIAGSTNTFGLKYADIWYLAEGTVAAPAYVWKNWGENYGYTLGNKMTSPEVQLWHDPPNSTDSLTADQISAGLIRGPYPDTGTRYDYVIDTTQAPMGTTFPLWQFTWILIENPNGSGKNMIIDYVQIYSIAPRHGDSQWPTTASKNSYRDRMSCQLLGKWKGVGTGTGCVRNASTPTGTGLLNNATIGSFPVGKVERDDGAGYMFGFNARGDDVYTDYYPDGTEMAVDHQPAYISGGSVFYPWQRVKFHDSRARYGTDVNALRYRMLLAPNEAAVGIIAFSLDATSNAKGAGTRSLSAPSSTGWGINGCQIAFRWYAA